jgi:hypothetical protein
MLTSPLRKGRKVLCIVNPSFSLAVQRPLLGC